MKIVNINYKGFVIKPEDNIDYGELCKKQSPQSLTYKSNDGETLLVFASGKCRVMGCKKHISHPTNMFPIPIQITHIQSVTATLDLGYTLNLYALAKQIGMKRCIFEPEIFPALRLTRDFAPLCVNVFASGKVVILGLKTLSIRRTCWKVKLFIDSSYIHKCSL